MKTIVINLKSRPERLKKFQNYWSSFLDFEVSDGILHDVPHTGCGLAHIAAIRKGLQHSEWCLILEDDAELDCPISEFLDKIDNAVKLLPAWGAVNLGAVSHLRFDKPECVTKINDHFFKVSRTKSLRSCTAMLWSHYALPFINTYEQILLNGHIFPIDRMLFAWKYPWILDTFGEGDECFNSIQINVPDIYISRKCLVIQKITLSDNTGILSEDLRDDYLEKLFTMG
jgi:GR25 family glycosyltransferase involved in LPS biosynthesis